MKIRITFYSRTFVDNKYSYKEECKGEIFGKNIWVEKPKDLPGCESTIANFEYLYNKTYARTSDNKVNTHFKYKISRNKFYDEPVFARLSFVQRFKLKIIMEETGFQRNPIEFGLLLITFLGVISATVVGLLNRQDQKRDQIQLNNELEKLRLEIKNKEFKLENSIESPDSIINFKTEKNK